MKWSVAFLGLSACTGVLSDPAADPHADALGRYVFATRAVFGAGELHGVAGADQICAQRAASAGLRSDGDVPYRAWLSSIDASVSRRFLHAGVPYKLVDGTVIAENWADLVDGALAHAIDHDEYAEPIEDERAEAWTYTYPDGTAPWERNDPIYTPRLDCEGWTSGLALGWPGAVQARGGIWTSTASGVACSVPHHLYCFEQ